MWAQEWNNIYDLVDPYPNEPSLDVGKKLAAAALGREEDGQARASASSRRSGFDPLPETFWERSLFTRPRDREVVCHASAWDVSWSGDLRIKMCIEPTEEDLVTIHHELGHDFYFQRYDKLPILFQQGANDGFHEAIGDTIALSVTPDVPEERRPARRASRDNEHARINQQMKMALDKVAFLPFGLLIDKWRWDVFSGKIAAADYDEGVVGAARRSTRASARRCARTEDDFDPGAKYHVASSTPYVVYFLARIYQFQFHRALCKAAGYTGPLDQCSIHDNKAAGAKLMAMLAHGREPALARRAWRPSAAGRKADAGADARVLRAALRRGSREENKGQAVRLVARQDR